MNSRGRIIHGQAERAREQGNFLKALEYTDQATLSYQQDRNYLGLSEIQSSRQSTFKQLYRQTNDPMYLILEKYAAISAVQIAKKSQIKEALAIPYHNLGKYYEEAGQFQQAAKYFAKAVYFMQRFPPKHHNRPAVVADIRVHQHVCEYLAGGKTALQKAEQALKDLEEADEPSTYNKNVWLSGAHLRIANMLKKDNPKKAKEHLDKAKKIINSDSRLILRKEQLKELEQEFI